MLGLDSRIHAIQAAIYVVVAVIELQKPAVVAAVFRGPHHVKPRLALRCNALTHNCHVLSATVNHVLDLLTVQPHLFVVVRVHAHSHPLHIEDPETLACHEQRRQHLTRLRQGCNVVGLIPAVAKETVHVEILRELQGNLHMRQDVLQAGHGFRDALSDTVQEQTAITAWQTHLQNNNVDS